MSDKNIIESENQNESELLNIQIAELEDKWKRSMADFANFKKRVEQERSNIIEFSNLVLIKKLIPIIDNLQLASKHTEDLGIKMIYNQFEDLLKNEGLTKIDCTGKDYDANTMEAVEKQGKESQNSKAIVKTTIKEGYTLNNKLIRPAQVVVTYE